MASDKAYTRHADGSVEWDFAVLAELGFRKGTVLRVGMKNFLTYDSCEVFPGPRLNVVLGPNGTGKSTITHAICLACCGAPSTVGRSDDLRQFVKHNKEEEECYVEVDILYELSNGDGRALRIRRALSAAAKTKLVWTHEARAICKFSFCCSPSQPHTHPFPRHPPTPAHQ